MYKICPNLYYNGKFKYFMHYNGGGGGWGRAAYSNLVFPMAEINRTVAAPGHLSTYHKIEIWSQIFVSGFFNFKIYIGRGKTEAGATIHLCEMEL